MNKKKLFSEGKIWNSGGWLIVSMALILVQCMANGNRQISRPDPEISHEKYVLPVYNTFDVPDIRKYKDLFSTPEYWTTQVEDFYRKRDYKMAWIADGRVKQKAFDLVEAVTLADQNGIPQRRYPVVLIYSSIKKLNSSPGKLLKFPASYVNLDVLLTYTYLQYANDLLSGCINPGRFDIILETHPRKKDLMEYMNKALENDNIITSLEELQPDHRQYRELRKKLQELLEQEKMGDYATLNYVPVLSENDTNINILKIKKFLKSTGDLSNGDDEYYAAPVFDEEMVVAIKLFQYRYGLKPDGKLNKETLERMNMLFEEKIDKVRINMERIRWLPEDLGKRYILVNLPDYSMKYYENDTLRLEMKVIIGKIDNYTPVLKDTLRYIVFNPQWNIPWSIASGKMLDNLKSDSSYYKNSSYSFFRNSYTSGDTVQTDSIDWSAITAEDFPYYAVQHSGPYNALGRVKFMFPNNESIYLHDTPSDSLFSIRERDLSHGCVRLQKPIELAAQILNEQEITLPDIRQILKENKPDTVFLDDPVMVHFVYHTAWIDDAENLHFSDDIYDLDKTAIKLLYTSPVKASSGNYSSIPN